MITKQNLFIPRLPQKESYSESLYKKGSVSRDVINGYFSNKLATFGLVLLLILIFSAIIIPFFAQDPLEINSLNSHLSSSKSNWFGTDAYGRDIWARVWVGLGNSLVLAITISVIVVVFGTLMGILMSYYKTFDKWFGYVVKGLFALPGIFILIVLSAIIGTSFWSMVLALSVTGWTMISQQVRTQALRVKNSEFIEASQILGRKTSSILTLLVKYSIPIIIIQFVITIPQVILSEAVLGFLGLSIPDIPTLGNVIAAGRSFILTNPMEVVYPLIILLATSMSIQIIGFGIEDSYKGLGDK